MELSAVVPDPTLAGYSRAKSAKMVIAATAISRVMKPKLTRLFTGVMDIQRATTQGYVTG